MNLSMHASYLHGLTHNSNTFKFTFLLMNLCSYLLQCVASHPETRVPFMKGKISAKFDLSLTFSSTNKWLFELGSVDGLSFADFPVLLLECILFCSQDPTLFVPFP